jgi:translation initiation factor 1
MARSSSLVYSTDAGRHCPECNRPVAACACRQLARTARAACDGIVRLRRETKGRGGKGVTLIDGLPLEEDALLALAKQLKNKCSSGGTVKDGVIEIQGDHRIQLQSLLEAQGYKVKLAGG